MRHKYSELREEEARLARLVITGNLTQDAYEQLRQEWQEKIVNVQCKIDELELDLSQCPDDLEVALALLTNMSKLYERLGEKEKNNLLQIVAKRIIINPQGEIVDYELHSPFSYLDTLASHFGGKSKEGRGSSFVRSGSQLEPLDDVERFLSSIQFGSRKKVQELLEIGGN